MLSLAAFARHVLHRSTTAAMKKFRFLVGISPPAACSKDIRPLRMGLLNLMPNKIVTEVQFARLIGATPLQVELVLVRIANSPMEFLKAD